MRRVCRLGALWLFLAGILLLSGPAELARTGGFPARRAFLDEGPMNLHLVGSSVRYRNAIPFYTLAYYVNLAELRSALGPGTRSIPELSRVLIQGKVAQCYVTRFEQSISKDRRMEFLLENLRRYWEGPGFRSDAPAMKSFLPFFDAALERGEETRIWIRNGAIFTGKGGQKPVKTEDPDLCRAFANSYLGDLRKPGADRIMREDLLKDLPALLESVASQRKPSAR
jgi:hypothetical protein